METVKIEERLISRIGVREWGLPSLLIPGQIWRSEQTKMIMCCIAAVNPSKVTIQQCPLEVIPAGELSVMPSEWRAALWEYVQAYPNSGCCYGPFLAITDAERCDFIRKIAQDLVASDNIGCRSIANSIGEFAAWGFELISDTFSTRTGFRF